jgi:hypothetical protein
MGEGGISWLSVHHSNMAPACQDEEATIRSVTTASFLSATRAGLSHHLAVMLHGAAGIVRGNTTPQIS